MAVENHRSNDSLVVSRHGCMGNDTMGPRCSCIVSKENICYYLKVYLEMYSFQRYERFILSMYGF